MGDPSQNSSIIGLTGKMLMAGVILLFFVAGFVLFLQLYAKWFWYRPEEEEQQQHSGNRTVTRRRRRLDFSPGHNESAVVFPRQQRSLDQSVLKSLPVVDYESKDFKEGLECAVCLSDLADGEKLRLLPKCNHGFHLECIDMWFQSHSTCPLCRSAVSSSTNIVNESISLESILGLQIGDIIPDDGPNFPTNVLFCGDETRIITFGLSVVEDISYSHSQPPSSSSSSSSSSPAAATMVVIDIPSASARQGNDDEGLKSPLTTRLRSLKRLLSRDKDRRLNPSSSGGSVEEEQGSRDQI
ncbi:RING-H2 finger protein ATL60-like [Impatiens glandulifera]|uniref:RING-H2 finger protein ATL60-like n=1 Tax=Impatiens glandulifera TaxID=253017 RepID=UPI001FB0E1E5|nr:RING-H2 finger protein ATL60-like [Impatiens glandulifera]